MCLNRNEKENVERRLRGTIACIPDAPGATLNQKEACAGLNVNGLIITKDDVSNKYWVRPHDYDRCHLPSLVKAKKIVGFSLQIVEKDSDEEKRLRESLTKEILVGREHAALNDEAELEQPSDESKERATTASAGVSYISGEPSGGGPSRDAHSVIPPQSATTARALNNIDTGDETKMAVTTPMDNSKSNHSGLPGFSTTSLSNEGIPTSLSISPSLNQAVKLPGTNASILEQKTPHAEQPKSNASKSPSLFDPPRASVPVRSTPAFFDLPDEAIIRVFQIYLDDGSSSTPQDASRIRELYWEVGRPVRRAMASIPTLWTHLHPRSPPAFIEASLQRSGAHLISIYLEDKPGDAKRCLSTMDFLALLKPQRSRWGSIDVTVAPWSQSLGDLIKELETPIPSLRTLSTTLPGTSMTTTVQFAFGLGGIAPLIAVLNGDTQGLAQLTLGNLRLGPHPSPFNSLRILDLSGQVQITYASLLRTLATAEALQRLQLTDIDWLDNLECPLFAPETLLLPQMRNIILIETNRSTGLTNLLHLLSLATCARFTLQTSEAEDLLDDLIPVIIAPIIARTLSNLLLSNEIHLRTHFAANELIWKGGTTSDDARDVGFDIELLCLGSKGPQEFLCFVNRTMEIAETHRFISVNINDSLSGLVAPLPKLEHVISIPTLHGHDFDGMKVVHIAAEVFEDRLGYIKDMLIKGQWPHLTSMTLQYKQESQLEGVLELCSWLQHSLSALVQDLQSVYGLVEADTSEEGRAVIIFWDKLIALLQS
ncbi:hypothetical protein FRB90_004248 [Tulasnella sp. 427]|nr:hypothetical protein FRB90_004248 [Tulasnella sp. 427]